MIAKAAIWLDIVSTSAESMDEDCNRLCNHCSAALETARNVQSTCAQRRPPRLRATKAIGSVEVSGEFLGAFNAFDKLFAWSLTLFVDTGERSVQRPHHSPRS